MTIQSAQQAGALKRTKAISSMRENEEHADLTIECGGRTYRVHKNILCAQSEWFRAACRKDTFKEGRQSTIVLHTPSSDPAEDNIGLDDPEAIRIMISYLYDDEYKTLPTLIRPKEGGKRVTPEDDRTLSTHASVFAAAVKYGLPGLRDLAAACYVEIASGPHIKNQVIAISDIAQAIRTAHSMVPPDVKDLRKATSSRRRACF
ncbi:hypothetical protein LTR56_013786 [Elasticomyces elasticus]|nr:hypothetical protein LTR56_013786 [Elasticomyces elasticus]KAK4907110.1 hypothetical protein LTR49_023853 [Elasticomyces elasticus]